MDPPSTIRQIVNGRLDRAVDFEYITCEVDDKAGSKKQVAAIVVPDIRRRPHVTTKEIKEQVHGKDKFWLREREVWVRKTGGRELATAEELDTVYEGKLRRLVEDQVQPLRTRLERLERDLREQRNAIPDLSFGLSVDDIEVPSLEGQPYPVLGNLIPVEEIHKEIEEAKQRVSGKNVQAATINPAYIGAYKGYRDRLEAWLRKLEDILAIDFVMTNTGRIPAEDVNVTLSVPAELQPSTELPSRPQRPYYVSAPLHASRISYSKQSHPDLLIGPVLLPTNASGVLRVQWEVGKLYHHRPLLARVGEYEGGGILISASSYGQLKSRAGEEVPLHYEAHAANILEALRGVLILE